MTEEIVNGFTTRLKLDISSNLMKNLVSSHRMFFGLNRDNLVLMHNIVDHLSDSNNPLRYTVIGNSNGWNVQDEVLTGKLGAKAKKYEGMSVWSVEASSPSFGWVRPMIV